MKKCIGVWDCTVVLVYLPKYSVVAVQKSAGWKKGIFGHLKQSHLLLDYCHIVLCTYVRKDWINYSWTKFINR